MGTNKINFFQIWFEEKALFLKELMFYYNKKKYVGFYFLFACFACFASRKL